MSKLSLVSLLSTTVALTAFLVTPAGAVTLTVGGNTVAGEGIQSSQAGATTMTFDGLTALPAGFTATNANTLVTGSIANLYSTPTFDTSTFLSTGVGTITETLSGVNYFGFEWGSPDGYNTFTLTDSNGAMFSYFGTAIPGGGTSTAVFVNFFSNPGTTFTKATFSSSAPSFEVDNIAVAVVAAAIATPEPSTLAMLGAGLLIGAGSLRRKRAAR